MKLFDLEIESNTVNTLAGYILEVSEGELPQIGATVRDDKLDFTITQVSENRIERLIIRKTEE